MSTKEVAFIVLMVMLGSTLGRVIASAIVDEGPQTTVRVVVERSDGQ